MFPIISKEIKGYLNSATAYMSILFFLVVSSIWFFYFYQFEVLNKADLRGYFISYPILFVILIPSLTMRSFSEELRSGTFEILMTLPYTETVIVLAKFFSALAMLLMILFFSLPIPIMLSYLGDFDTGVLFTQYLGVILLGCICISIGQFISSLTTNQITSFLVSSFILLIIIFMGRTEKLIPSNFFHFLNWISLNFHFESFNKGIIDFRDLVYYVVMTVLFLFLNQHRLLIKKYS